MPSRNSFYWGMVAGMLVSVAAQAGNWLITPMSHPNASTARLYGVIAQGLLCLAAALWLVRRERATTPLPRSV
jgi:peptidoglycan biosynthesis protein MviN/MurJ (putative lipid II flippase)